jgi:hypothetical protein
MSRLLSIAAAAAFLLPGLCRGADAVAPVPAPLPAASRPAVPGSLAVQAAENARAEPGGATQPEGKAVPQVSVPLRRSTAPDDGSAGAGMGVGPSGQGGIDDDAARCSSRKTRKERADCRKAVAAQTKNSQPFAR